MKKIISVILIITIVATLFTSCKKEEAGESAKETTTTAQQAQQNAASGDSSGFLVGGEDHVELGKPGKNLDPQEVYSKIKYTKEMFCGEFKLPGGMDAPQDYKDSVSGYIDFNYEGEDLEISALPYELVVGEDEIDHALPQYIEGYDWALLYFYTRESYSNGVFCDYEVTGNKIIFKPLSYFEFNEEKQNFDYAFSDTTFEYEFSFSGRNLTLSSGDESITLKSGLDYEGKDDISAYGYIASDSKSIGNIENIGIAYYEDTPEYNYVDISTLNNKIIYNAVAYIQENGLITITIPYEEVTKTYQLVYFYCGSDGWIFADEKNVYYYNVSVFDYYKSDTDKYTSDEQSGILDNLTEDELEEIVEKKDSLLTDLETAFEAEGISVTINEEHGELVIDSSVIFGGDSAELSADGKAFLNKFLKAYTSIVFSPEYEDFILKTVVEGHTAPLSGSTYESGLPLSEERAEVVRDYCISSETGVDTTKLANALEAVGYSNSKPIHDADGNVDMDASRRVSFKFIINLDA